MRNSELYELYRNYNSDKDSSGNYGIQLIDMIVKRAGSLERVDKWLMLERCRSLEREAFGKSRVHQ